MRHNDTIPRGASVDNLAMEVMEQADELFPKRTDDSMFKKLFSEVGELVEEGTEEEWADVMIMLLDFGARKQWALEKAIRNKMMVNQGREWEFKNGVARHVK